MDLSKEEGVVVEIGNEISPPSAKPAKRCIQSKLSWHKPRAEKGKSLVIEEEKEEKEKCDEIEGDGKKKGKSRPRTPKRELQSSQLKLPWRGPPDDEANVIVTQEEIKESQESKDEEMKREEIEGDARKKGKSRARTPIKELKYSQSKLPWRNPPDDEEMVTVTQEEVNESQESKDERMNKGNKRKSLPRTPQKSPAKRKERRSSMRNKGSKNCYQLRNEQTGEDTPKTSPTSREIEQGGSSSKKSLNNKRYDAISDIDGPKLSVRRPLTDLWLEAKMSAEENLRLSAGKQTHPFFASRKTKRSHESHEKKVEMRCWSGLDGDYTVSCPPVHVFDTLEDNIASFDWKNWEFTETFLSDLSCYRAIEKASSVFDGSVKPLILDNNNHERMDLNLLPDQVHGRPLSTSSIKPTSIDWQRFNVAPFSSEHTLSQENCSVDNLENKQQDKSLTERLTSYYQRISYWPECSLWTNKYQPENALEVCGNRESVRLLNEWLKSWNERVLQTSTKKNLLEHCDPEDSEDSMYEIESDMDDEAIHKNVLLITGPIGSGKSAAVYACAKEQGFEVIEVNTSDVRNGTHMKQVFGQAVDSHALNKWSAEDPNGPRNGSIEIVSGSSKQEATHAKISWNASEKIAISQTANKSLILFEDVDTVFDEDRGFIASVLQLVETAKRPIILTSNYRKPVLPQLLDRFVLDFNFPTSDELLSHLYMICASEKAHVSSDMLEYLVRCCLGDIRKTLMLLQFWCQGKGPQTERSARVSYSPMGFDINAAYSIVPRLVPWELPCKLSEKVGDEINKTAFMVEENLQRMEVVPQELTPMTPMKMIDLHLSSVSTPVKPRKRALFKRKSSFLDSADLLDHSDIEDFCDDSDSLENNAQRTVKHKRGIVLSSQSDDGSADECLQTQTVNDHQMLDKLKGPISQTSGMLDLNELPTDPICRYKRGDIVQQPLEIFETGSVSHICDTFKLQDVSYVPESSFIFGTETNGEEDFLAITSHNTCFNLTDSISPIHGPPGDANNLDRTTIEQRKCLEDNAGTAYDIDVESVNGNEEQEDNQNEDESISCRYHLMDECSRADFNMRLLPGISSPEVDLVQETWTKLRCNRDDLKLYVPVNRKDVLSVVNHVSRLADLISEADINFKSCYPLVNDIVEPTMWPCAEPDICSCYEDQMEMGSIYAQHGLCLYAKKFAELGFNLGHAITMDLAEEMLASSMNTVALGKLLSRGKVSCHHSDFEGSLHITKPTHSIPNGREVEAELYDAILSTVPARLSMVVKDTAFHEYVSFLSKLSRLESSRLSLSIEGRRRSRASRHYLSSGPYSLSDGHVQLLAHTGCFKS
ncbi:uncharacterized protein LOC109833706 isoform X2 [Asparagus officinalis]|uniref:uncharacterized protein LOC109833706 isoform X2 n=1 Tax=Asparagus officinalis TaxID=4686 RepID=UPI00098E5362|nr:uncharacterized protein LOC109833706 isoform X2 [Asparagus officinalis]